MKERPILFSAPMVRALLAGSKTQTRRAIKPQPAGTWAAPGKTACPYGVAGDRLWVREQFSGPRAWGDIPPSGWGWDESHVSIWYWADGNPATGDWTRPKPSIHMPRRFSRILLEITEVRVQLLQDISDDDCCAEGIDGPMCAALLGKSPLKMGHCERVAYAALWDQINGAGAWEANPFVWAVSFRRVEASA